MQQLLHYTHDHVCSTKPNTEAKFQQLFAAKAFAESQAQAQVHVAQQHHMQAAIRESHGQLIAMHQVHAAAVSSELESTAQSSVLSVIVAAQKAVTEHEAVVQESLQQELVQLQQTLENAIRADCETRADSIHADLKHVLERNQIPHEERIEKRLQERFQAARACELRETRILLKMRLPSSRAELKRVWMKKYKSPNEVFKMIETSSGRNLKTLRGSRQKTFVATSISMKIIKLSESSSWYISRSNHRVKLTWQTWRNASKRN